MEPVALFLNPEMKITLENPSIAVLRSDQLKEYVRRRAKEVKVSPTVMRAVMEHLAANCTYQDAPAPAAPTGAAAKA